LEYRLKSSLLGAVDGYDLVLIDCPPRPGGVLIRAALLASSHVLLATTPDASGLEGVRDSLRTIDTLRRFQHPTLQLAGMLRTITPPHEGEAHRAAEELHTAFGSLVLPWAVPQLAVHKRAHAASAPVGCLPGAGGAAAAGGLPAHPAPAARRHRVDRWLSPPAAHPHRQQIGAAPGRRPRCRPRRRSPADPHHPTRR
jgi:cellulose biosynthesis protein BcsQ